MALDPQTQMMIAALQNNPQTAAPHYQQMAGDVVRPPLPMTGGLNADQLYDRVLSPGAMGMNAIGRNGGLSTMPPNVAPMGGKVMDWYLRQGYPK